MHRATTFIAAVCCLLVACSGLKSYRSDYQKNLFITTDTDQGWLSGVNAALDIYEMQSECDVDYRGTVDLGHSPVEVGLPEGVPAYLVFRIESSAFLSNTTTSIGYDVPLYPEYGQVYDVNLSYHNNDYNVEVQERPRGSVEGQILFINTVGQDCGSDT